MSDGPENSAAAVESPPWAQITPDEFSAVDLNGPLANSTRVDTTELTQVYREAANEASSGQKASAGRVYSTLAALCSFHFQPSNRDEPFGPLARFDDRRTAIPGDFKGAPAKTLAANIERLENPAVRARVADTVWLLDRKQASAAFVAIDAYAGLIEDVRAGKKSFRSSQGIHAYEVADHLRRGIQIARAVAWEKESGKRVRSLVTSLRADAAQAKQRASFRRLATLDLDYKLSDAVLIAAEAEALAAEETSLEFRHHLLHVAARAHRLAGNEAENNQTLLLAAECLVTISEGHGDSGMFESHWLERAISEMQHIPETKERRRELKHKLVDAQARIFDELSRFSHEQDISEVANEARAAVSGKPLLQALRRFSALSRAPTRAELEDEARRLIAENPLSSMFPMTQYDAQGKPVYRDQGIEGDGSGAIQRQIAMAEKMRRSLLAQATIQPARLAILEEHYIDEDAIGLICTHSPLVPQDRTAIFVAGLVHFFHGEMTSALHILVPQLENSLRHVLRLHGHDVTRLNDDMTQDDLSLSVLLDKLRGELVAIFGEHMVTDIDHVFDHRSGPNLRNRLAHGLVGQWEPYADDANYACWLVFQLCCIPLRPKWDELNRVYEEIVGKGAGLAHPPQIGDSG